MRTLRCSRADGTWPFTDREKARKTAPPRPCDGPFGVDAPDPNDNVCEADGSRNRTKCSVGCKAGDATLCRSACERGDASACVGCCAYFVLNRSEFDPPVFNGPCEGVNRGAAAGRIADVVMKGNQAASGEYKTTYDQRAFLGLQGALAASRHLLHLGQIARVRKTARACGW